MASQAEGSGALPRQPRHKPITGRKVRVLALHGAPANSNVMHFQTAALRRQLGPNVEWIIPDAQWEVSPTEGLRYEDSHRYMVTRSAFEERLSKGKPFVSWFRLVDMPEDEKPDYGGWVPITTDAAMRDGSLKQLMDLVEEEAPIDVLVAFSQGVLIGTFLANCFRKAGKPIPWRLALLFTSTGPCLCDRFSPPLTVPAIFVTSPKYNEHFYGVQCMKELYADIVVVDHDDGLNFPISQPRALEIYERLGQEFWSRCREDSRRGTWADWCSGKVKLPSQRPLGDPGADSAAAADGDEDAENLPRVEVAVLAPEALAGLLVERACLVADARGEAEVRCSPFPGAQGDVGLARLQLSPQAAAVELARLREDGRRVVVVSADGERCGEYCALLVASFGFAERQVCRLAGGMPAWEAWEEEHEAEADEVRRALGGEVRPRKPRPQVASLGPQELADLLLAGHCVVADARQPQEARGRPLPGVRRELSLYVAERRPEEVRSSLQLLQEEPRERPLQVVAVSACGNRCRELAALLAERFGMERSQVSRLDGGLAAWAAWESANPAAASELRTAYGLPAVRRRA